jgi:site-specific DNA recombinase
MKRAAAYARYSTDSQDEKSIAYQMNAIEEYCLDKGYEIVDKYADEAFSGTNTNRPQFKRLLADAEDRKFDVVVVYDVTRGSRDVGDWFTFRKHMMYQNIDVESVHGHLGSYMDSDSFIAELINVGMGQREVLSNRQKSLDSKKLLAKQAKFLGGIPPFGYDVVNQQYVINEEEARVVRKIFDMYTKGKSYNEIIESIGKVRGKTGKYLTRNSLNGILSKEIYAGTYTFNKITTRVMRKYVGRQKNENTVRIENAVPAIIDKETWNIAQTRLNDRRGRGRYHAKRDYALSGLVHCATCGATYAGQYSKNKRGYGTRYYVCTNRRKKLCNSPWVNANNLESVVFAQIKEYFLNADYEELADCVISAYEKSIPTQEKERHELAEIERKIHNGVKAMLNGMDIAEMKEEINRLKMRKIELEETIKNAPTVKTLDRNALVDYFRNIVDNWDSLDKDRVLRENVVSIEIEKNGMANILLTMPLVEFTSGSLGEPTTVYATINC